MSVVAMVVGVGGLEAGKREVVWWVHLMEEILLLYPLGLLPGLPQAAAAAAAVTTLVSTTTFPTVCAACLTCYHLFDDGLSLSHHGCLV